MGVWSRDVDVVCGAQPVKIAERFGLHCGDATKQLAKRTPSRARRSRLGVRTWVLPEQPRSAAVWSSESRKTIFGGGGAAVCALNASPVPENVRREISIGQ